MMPTSMTKSLLLLCLILLSACFATAAFDVEDITPKFAELSFPAGNAYSLCTCSERVIRGTITNQLFQAATYTLTSGSEYVTVFPARTTLAPGQSQEVAVVFHPQCAVSEGVMTIPLQVLFSGSIVEQEILSISFTECQSLVTALNLPDRITCGDEEYVEFSVQNPSDFTEQYEVSSRGTLPFVIEEELITLKPRETFSTFLSLNYSCLDLPDNATLGVDVHALKSDLYATLEEGVIVRPGYTFDLERSNDNVLCLEEDYEFSIDSSADFSTEYRVSTDRDDVQLVYYAEDGSVRDMASSVDVLAYASQPLFVRANNGASGNVTIIVAAKTAGLDKQEHFSLDITRCYDFSVAPLQPVDLCQGEIEEVGLQVTNSGHDVQLFTLSSDTVFFEENEFSLFPGEMRQDLIVLEALDDQKITISTERESKEIDVPVTAHSLEDCYQLYLVNSVQRVRYADTSFFIPLQPLGLRTGEYNVSIEGDGASYFIANSLHVTNLSSTAYVEVFTHVSDDVRKRYDVMLHITTQEGIAQSFPLTIYQYDKTPSEMVTQYFKQNPCHVWTALLLVLIGLAVVLLLFVKSPARKKLTEEEKKLSPKKRKSIRAHRLFYIGLFLAAFFVLVALFAWQTQGFFPNNPVFVHDDVLLDYEMYAGDSLTFSLNEFFSDPDMEELTYQVMWLNGSAPVSIEGDALSITPLVGGDSSLRFFVLAVDPYDASAVSPPIDVRVFERTPLTVRNFFIWFCVLINLALLFIFLILVFFLIKRRTR